MPPNAETPAGSLGVFFMPHLRLATSPNDDPKSRALVDGFAVQWLKTDEFLE